MSFLEIGKAARDYNKLLVGMIPRGTQLNGLREAQAVARYNFLSEQARKTKFLPWTQDLIEGLPFCGADVSIDAQRYADHAIRRLMRHSQVSAITEALRAFVASSPEDHDFAVVIAHHAIDHVADDLISRSDVSLSLARRIAAILLRFDIYRICAKDIEPVPEETFMRLLAMPLTSRSAIGHRRALEFKIGLLVMQSGLAIPQPSSLDDVINLGTEVTQRGLHCLNLHAENAITLYRSTNDQRDLAISLSGQPPTGAVFVECDQPTSGKNTNSKFTTRKLPHTDARDSSWEQPSAREEQDSIPGVIVFASVGSPETERGAKIIERLKAIEFLNKPMPLIQRPNYDKVKTRLLEIAPQSADIVSRILGDFSRRSYAWLEPTILVGPPGTAKTAFVTELSKAISGAVDIFPCGGVIDAQFAGTARGWSTAQPSLPVDVILHRGVANPVIILDEIEKVGTGRSNGNLLDALLGMIEPSSAKTWRDPMIQGACDLSHIIWMATANSVDEVPSALRDRFRVLQFPEPRIEHLPVICRSLLKSIRRDHGIQDERLVPDLLPFELDALSSIWSGGSIRKLRRLVEGVLAARDHSMVRN